MVRANPIGRETMTPSQQRYVTVETAISVAINTAFSIAFVFFVFGGMTRIATPALVPDAIPQSFMIALMATIVPTLLTRKRRRSGIVAGTGGYVPKALAALLVRAVIFALVATVCGLAIQAALLTPFAPVGLSFAATLAFKAGFGALLAAIVTPVALRFALADTGS